MRLRRIAPGSVYPDGSIVAWDGKRWRRGPCWLDLDDLKSARLQMMNDYGWRVIHPVDWPGFPPRSGMKCVKRFQDV